MGEIYEKESEEIMIDKLIPSIRKKQGGNRKPKRIRSCEKCKNEFAVDHLYRRYCSRRCAYDSRARTKVSVSTREARNAQRRLKYAVDTGKMKRPKKCENCGEEKKIEAAHHSYDEPLKVRWLCRSCHVRWDKNNPKKGTISKNL